MEVDVIRKFVKAFFPLQKILREGPINVHSHAEALGTESNEPGLTETAMATGTLDPHFPDELPDFGMKFAPTL